MPDVTIHPIQPNLILPLFGARDQHLRRLRDFFQVEIVHRNGSILISGAEEKIQQAAEVLQRLKKFVEKHGGLTPEAFDQTMTQVTGVWPKETAKPVETSVVGVSVRPRTPGQAEYIQQIRQNDLTFAVGPAGSGKTYLAVALAIEALRSREVRKIVLVRPAVEAGESLGFLPGDLLQKIQPYLRPLMDAINELMGFETGQRLLQTEVIEVLPLAYMRGRTLNESFIILDEAQNATVAQMKMFLTRMGHGSKIVVAGDTTQVDLPRGTNSGLFDAIHRLKNVPGIAFSRLCENDIVRHPLVQRIVNAYETIAERDGTKPRPPGAKGPHEGT